MERRSGEVFDAHLAGCVLDATVRRTEQMVSELLALATIESPSTDPEAAQPVLDRLEARLRGHRMRTLRVPGRTSGGMLLAAGGTPTAPEPFQLLIGHADTVWPIGTTLRRPPTRTGDVVTGPGTFDMKAGLVSVATALDVLDELGASPEVVPVVLVNTDEEVGSRESTATIAALAAASDRVFVLEPALGARGALKTARKGLGRYTVTVHGKAAHAGLDPASGASAILELSAVIQALFALNDPERGVTVNVGMVSGGIQPNVVAPESSAVIDVRVLSASDAERVDADIRALRAGTPGTSLTIEGGMGRPPLERTERNRELFERARDVAGVLGLDLTQATAGGGSDGNTASQVAPTLDGLGATGDGAHAEHEQVHVAGWVERTALLAGLLLLPPVRDEPMAPVADPLALVEAP